MGTELIKKIRNSVVYLYVRISGFLRSRGIYGKENTRRLAAYRDKHAGERCFLIGNGPSLTIEDLDSIAGEKSIACNMVYQVFDRTAWRPTYHCVTETAYAKKYAEEFTERIDTPFFTTRTCRNFMSCCPANTVYVENVYLKRYRMHGNLLDYYVSPFASVMVFMLEMAVYMGFKEIYLLGVDNTNSLRDNGHFIAGYEDEEIVNINVERVQKQLKEGDLSPEEAGEYQLVRARYAYQCIADYAAAHGIKIYNATRGGKLEIFERVNLSNVLVKNSDL